MTPRTLVAMAVLAASIGCRGASESAPKSTAGGEPATRDDPAPSSGAAPAPGVRDDGTIVSAVAWFEGSLEQAKVAARDQSKLIFIDVGAYWCPPCHELDEKVFTQPEVGAWLDEHAIALHIDAEKGEGPEIVERYHVQAYPTMLVLEAGGLEKGRVVDSLEPAALLTKLDAIAAGGNVLAELEAAVEAAPDDLEARYDLAHAYVLAARREQAEAQYAVLLEADPDNAEDIAARVLYDRAMFSTMKLDGDLEGAITELRELQARFPDSPQASKAFRIIGRAYCKLGKPDEAVASLEAMVAADPDDPNLKSRWGWFAFRQDCRPDAGLEAVLAGIAQDPDSAELRYLEAELRRLTGDPDGALAAIRKASELEPASAYYKRQVRRFQALAEPR